MNVVSSVGIIMANKQLMSANGYSFTFAKHVPLWELLWFSIVANMSITGMNLSPHAEFSVDFTRWILHSKRYSKEVKAAVVVVVIGVGVCTVTDVKVNAKGFNMRMCSSSIGSLQKKYSIGAFELLSKTAPIQALSLLVLGPFIDYYLSGD
ncbi:hypothetical protein Hdeb2414_s0464g00899281 [Helianthus debilis subsp. tardiflorus]